MAELIQLMDERDKIMCATPGRMCNIPQPLMYKIAMIQAQLKEKVRGNEFCPCQSGLKYKKCCGRDEQWRGLCPSIILFVFLVIFLLVIICYI